MTTRIKIIQYVDGTKKYVPQSKTLFFWTGWYDERGGSVEKFDTENEAIKFIESISAEKIMKVSFK